MPLTYPHAKDFLNVEFTSLSNGEIVYKSTTQRNALEQPTTTIISRNTGLSPNSPVVLEPRMRIDWTCHESTTKKTGCVFSFNFPSETDDGSVVVKRYWQKIE